MSRFVDIAARDVIQQALTRAQDAAALIGGKTDSRWLEQCAAVDPAEAIRNLMHERRTGAARECSDELDKRRPITGANSIRIPWETIALRSARYSATRADIAATTTLGGYLVPTLNFGTAAQALMAMLLLGRLGATPVDAVAAANMALPKVNSSASPYWLSTETTQSTETDQTYGQLNFSPHTVGGYTEISRLLLLQSNAGDVVANDLGRRLGRAIEAAAFAGTGTSGQPRGLTGQAGVNAVSGASFALSTAMTAATDTGDALTDDAAPGWAANRSVASLLRQRQEFNASSTRTLWDGALTWGDLAGFPAGSTSGIASGTAFFGNWRYLVLVDFAGGLDLEVNPFGQSNFQAGIVGLRALATIDVGPVWPGAFSTVSGIT